MKKIYTLLLLALSTVSFAQTYNYTVYTPSNTNMINATVNHITSDSNGLLWMTSFAGLASFNGTTFTNYTPDNSGLQTNSVTKVVVDNLNRKWMSTYQNGIIMFNGTTFTNYTESNSQLLSNVINDIAVDASNNVWIATDSGLSKFNGTTWTNYNEVNGIDGNNVSSVGIDAGNVYISTSGTILMKMNGSTFTSLGQGVLKILETKNNDVYAWTLYGFSKFVNGDMVANYNYLAGGSCLMDCQPNNIDIDENNKIWVANQIECANGGIQNFSDCNNYTWTGANEINYVTASKMNNSNTVWVFVAELGLIKMVKTSLAVDEMVSNTDQAMVFPNPAENILNVSFDQKITTVSIYNVLGQEVMTKAINANEGQIDISSLGSGTYFAKVNAGNQAQTLKVVKK